MSANRRAPSRPFGLNMLARLKGGVVDLLARKPRPRGANRRRRATTKLLGPRKNRRRTAKLPATTTQEPAKTHLQGGLRSVLTLMLWALPFLAATAAFVTPMLGVKAYEYVMESSHFHVREVLVEGNEHLTYDDVKRFAGITPGTHVLKADLDGMAERLEGHAWIRSARLRRELPSRLIVELVEHEPAAYVTLGTVWLADKDGSPFTPAYGHEVDGLPMVTGIPHDAFDADATAGPARTKVRRAINISRLYAAMGLAARWPIAEVRLDPIHDATLVLSGLGTEVVLGQGPYHDKLFRLEFVLENLRQQQKTAEYIVLDLSRHGTRIGGADGRVVVKADVRQDRQALVRQAAERAKLAEATRANWAPDADIFGATWRPSAAADVLRLGDTEVPEHRPLSGGRPVVPHDDLNGEE